MKYIVELVEKKTVAVEAESLEGAKQKALDLFDSESWTDTGTWAGRGVQTDRHLYARQH